MKELVLSYTQQKYPSQIPPCYAERRLSGGQDENADFKSLLSR